MKNLMNPFGSTNDPIQVKSTMEFSDPYEKAKRIVGLLPTNDTVRPLNNNVALRTPPNLDRRLRSFPKLGAVRHDQMKVKKAHSCVDGRRHGGGTPLDFVAKPPVPVATHRELMKDWRQPLASFSLEDTHCQSRQDSDREEPPLEGLVYSEDPMRVEMDSTSFTVATTTTRDYYSGASPSIVSEPPPGEQFGTPSGPGEVSPLSSPLVPPATTPTPKIRRRVPKKHWDQDSAMPTPEYEVVLEEVLVYRQVKLRLAVDHPDNHQPTLCGRETHEQVLLLQEDNDTTNSFCFSYTEQEEEEPTDMDEYDSFEQTLDDSQTEWTRYPETSQPSQTYRFACCFPLQ